MRKHQGRGSVLDGVAGAVWSYEAKRGNGSGLWHPPFAHGCFIGHSPDKFSLSAEWENITGDSKIVDVRPISQDDPASGFIEVFKYAVKFSDQPETDTVSAYQVLKGRRLIVPAAFGALWFLKACSMNHWTACHTLTCLPSHRPGLLAAKGSGGPRLRGRIPQTDAADLPRGMGASPCRTYAAQLARLNFF